MTPKELREQLIQQGNVLSITLAGIPDIKIVLLDKVVDMLFDSQKEVSRITKFAETLAKMGDDAPRFIEIVNLEEQVWKHREELTHLRQSLQEAREAIGETAYVFDEERKVWVCVHCARQHWQDKTRIEHAPTCIVLKSSER